MKRIAAITMVRNDDFYLKKWVEYYGVQLGRENLYVYFDGKDQTVGDFCKGVHTVLVDKIEGMVAVQDKGRIRFLSQRAAELFASGYELVIGVDCDEFLVVDPRLGKSLPEYLSGLDIRSSVSGLGLDFGQKLGEEADICEDRPFLQQRHYAQLGTRYTKTAVLAAPLEWGSGFHRVEGHNFHIAKDLYLLHFGYFDKKRLEDRFKDPARLKQGWERHMKKRSRTIRLVSTLKARNFERWTSIARVLQTLLRPPYAWNKPGMLGLRIIVRIPERFRDLV